MLWYTKIIIFFGQTPKGSIKVLFKMEFFFLLPFIVVLGTHRISRWDLSKLIIKSIAQKVMAKSGFIHRFHDLKYFEVDFFFHIL